MAKSISSFVNAMNANGGMSLTTGYNISWILPPTLKGDLTKRFPGWEQDESPINMMVEEAQLPNIQSATGQLQGRYLGENQIQYPYARLYSDVSFTWMCDANLTPLKFFHYWYNYMYSGSKSSDEIGLDESGESFGGVKNLAGTSGIISREVRMKYPEKYLGKCIVIKTEPGAATVDDRASMAFVLEDIFPYSIDSVPLSYGTSQLTKVSVNFHYAKHTVIDNDISKYGTGGDFKKIIDDLKKSFGVGN
jgi:hypothetical protein